MVLKRELDKAWIIECKDKKGNKSIRGGICVSNKGIILTCGFDITSKDLLGRYRSRDKWFKLDILIKKPNFNLVLLQVRQDVDLLRGDELGFPVFDLNEEENVDLLRGDKLHGLLHRHNKPFLCLFGNSCGPFTVKMVNFPSMVSKATISETGDSKQEILDSPLPYLCTKHVISEDHDDEGYPLHLLHPDIPVIQVHGFGGGIGSEGGPVFNDRNVFIGIYCFDTNCFQYVLPKSLLNLFVCHSLSSLKQTSMENLDIPTKKTRELGSTSDAPPSQNPNPSISSQFRKLGPENSQLDAQEEVLGLGKVDLKSKKRRRHQGRVEARVSQLASMGFDRSKARNSQGTKSEAFGELLEKDVTAAVCEHMSCGEAAAAASCNCVNRGRLNYNDGESPSTFADGDDSSSSEEGDKEIEDAFLGFDIDVTNEAFCA